MNLRKIIIAVICFVLVSAITLQIRTMAKQGSEVTKSFANSELKDSLLQWKEKYNNASADLKESSKELDKIRQTSTDSDSDSKKKSEELKQDNMLLGLVDVSGEGVIVTAKDGQAPKATDDISQYLVHDADLREIVSELSNAGAEAISINGERIVNSTCITCAGNVISINGEKVTSPFVIRAIGNQDRLYGINRPGGYLTYMKDYTSVDVKKSSNVQIPKYNGALSFKYAKTVKK